MCSTNSSPWSAPLRGAHGRRTFCALIVMPRSRSMSILSRYWARICRPSTIPVTSSIRSASVDLPWSMWAMMQKFRMRAGSRGAGVVTVPPSSHGPNAGRVFDPEVAPRPAPDRQSPAPSPARPVLVAAVCALLAGLAVEAAPLVGGDLIAQTWWASWASSVGWPVDLGWYGGVPVASYSLLGPWLAAAVGLPAAGIAGTVLGAASTTALLGRLRPSPGRWTAAGGLAALAGAADQRIRRTTVRARAALGWLAVA